MRKKWQLSLALAVLALSVPASAHEDDLPEGPIRERHELMEKIGDNAKKIGQAMKAGRTDEIAEPARELRDAAPKIDALFPEGSTHPKSRALDAIWKDWTGWQRDSKEFQEASAALVTAAETQTDLQLAVKRLFDSCKGCHEAFRAPED